MRLSFDLLMLIYRTLNNFQALLPAELQLTEGWGDLLFSHVAGRVFTMLNGFGFWVLIRAKIVLIHLIIDNI